MNYFLNLYFKNQNTMKKNFSLIYNEETNRFTLKVDREEVIKDMTRNELIDLLNEVEMTMMFVDYSNTPQK